MAKVKKSAARRVRGSKNAKVPVGAPAKVKKSAAPDHLTMKLSAPGMTVLHRAGLGGLACTLKYIERAQKRGLLLDKELPGGLWREGAPWQIDARSVTLFFGKPTQAKDYLKKLFRIAFQIKDGLIYLPGQYEMEPGLAARADLQAGLTLTFLQHGKVRKLLKEPTTVTYDPEGAGVPGVVVEFRKCQAFKHQKGWQQLLDNKGYLTTKPGRVDGPLSPGAVVRHVAFTGDTTVEDRADCLLPLYFAMVGCLALPVNRGVAALLIPDVEDLHTFASLRPLMTPTTAKDCQVPSAADAVLQAQVRLRSKQQVDAYGLPGCQAMTFMPTPWAKQQKSRVATVAVPPGEDGRLDRFEMALAELPRKIILKTVKEKKGRGREKVTTERTDAFRVDSTVRPLVAENLALDRPWYTGFVRLMLGSSKDKGSACSKTAYERKGLNAMTNATIFWDHDGEAAVVRAVQEALRSRYGRIADENKSNPVGMKNRFAGEYDRWRLAFAGAKTPDQFRGALCDLFSRAGNNSVLRQSWVQVLPFLDARRWQLTRDLALLGLASYAGKGDTQTTGAPDSAAHAD
jgi:CRISPR-associated protein Cas8a1/Csx13